MGYLDTNRIIEVSMNHANNMTLFVNFKYEILLTLLCDSSNFLHAYQLYFIILFILFL